VSENGFLVRQEVLEAYCLARVDASSCEVLTHLREISASSLDGGPCIVVDLHPQQVFPYFFLKWRHGRTSLGDGRPGVRAHEHCRRAALSLGSPLNPRVRRQSLVSRGGTPGSGIVIHRYYDPVTGQFLNVDPLVDLTSAPYFYAGDDPVNLADPSGQDWWDSLIKAFVSGLASLGFSYGVPKDLPPPMTSPPPTKSENPGPVESTPGRPPFYGDPQGGEGEGDAGGDSGGSGLFFGLFPNPTCQIDPWLRSCGGSGSKYQMSAYEMPWGLYPQSSPDCGEPPVYVSISQVLVA